MFKNIKKKLSEYIFSEELDKIERVKAHYENLHAEIKKASYTQMTRELLSGIDPNSLNSGLYKDEPHILDQIEGEEAQMAFLRQIKDLKSNTALPKVLDYLVRVQIMHSVKTAEDMVAVNFARATINGLTLLKEEIDTLHVEFLERSTAEESYDKHGVL